MFEAVNCQCRLQGSAFSIAGGMWYLKILAIELVVEVGKNARVGSCFRERF